MSSLTADDRRLAPIAGDNPAGEDLRFDRIYDQIREARRADDPVSPGVWQHTFKEPDWAAVVRLAERALAEQSKDLQIAAWLTEAKMKIGEFSGLAEGLAVLRELARVYWDHGLFPTSEDYEDDLRAGVLEWLDRTLSAGIHEIAAHRLRQEIETPAGSIRLSKARREDVHGVAADIENALGETRELQRFLDDKYLDYSGLRATREALANRLNGLEVRGDESEQVVMVEPPAPKARSASTLRPEDQRPLAAVEPSTADSSGRVRFLRKLDLAEECLRENRLRLASLILEELSEIIDECHLETWESSALIGRVWRSLCDCYRDAPPNSPEAERSAKLFQRLCRLDPWQVLSAEKE
jgi:predicted component of type VI protein secretion system